MSVLRPFILGGIDGIITSFTIMASCSAAGYSLRVAFVIGGASLLADGVSMGVSEYLSSRAELSRGCGTSDVVVSPWKLGVVCFAAFVVCGAVPLAAYVVSGNMATNISLSLVALLLLGAFREPGNRFDSIVDTGVLGVLAGCIAYSAAAFALLYGDGTQP